jgi:hypothetical protein
MFADWNCIFRKLCASGGRVKARIKPWIQPGHDGVGPCARHVNSYTCIVNSPKAFLIASPG